jgi:hypothetical protein
MAQISRRSLLKTGGAAAASAALLSSAPFRTIADAAGNPNAVWCEVVRVELPALVHVRPLNGPLTSVSFPNAAADPSSCNRDGALGLGAFQPGDEAVIELQRRSPPLVGLRIDTCYRSFVGRVVANGVGRVVTTRGEFWLPSDARLRFYGVRDVEAPRSAIKSGVNLDVTVRFEPSNQRQVARFVAIGAPA